MYIYIYIYYIYICTCIIVLPLFMVGMLTKKNELIAVWDTIFVAVIFHIVDAIGPLFAVPSGADCSDEW